MAEPVSREERRLQRLDQLTRLQARRNLDLRFPEPEEARFQRSQMPYRVQAVRVAVLVATPLYILTSLLDWWLVPEIVLRTSLARALAILLCILLTLMMRRGWFRSRVEAVGVVMVLVLNSCQLYIAPLHVPALQPVQWLVSLLLVVYAVSVVHIRFTLSVALGLVVLLQTLAGILLSGELSTAGVAYIGIYLVSGVMVALFSNYLISRNRRQRYLQRAMLGLHRQGLYQQVNTLRQNIGHDELTGLGNRRGLDDYLGRLFDDMRRLGEARRARLPAAPELRRQVEAAGRAALVLLSIDNYQAFVARHGQSEGDYCLNAVARVIQRSMGGQDHFPARFGRHEFALVLPGMTEFDAQASAERIRRDLAAMGIPHEDNAETGVVTLSAGIAHTDRLAEPSHQALLEAADRALFRAQQEGGNRCRRYQPGDD